MLRDNGNVDIIPTCRVYQHYDTCTYILGHLDGGMQVLLCRTVPSGQKHPAEQRVMQMIAE